MSNKSGKMFIFFGTVKTSGSKNQSKFTPISRCSNIMEITLNLKQKTRTNLSDSQARTLWIDETGCLILQYIYPKALHDTTFG